MLCRFAAILCTVLIAGSPAFADETPPPRFARDVQPLLKRHCLKCHGPAKREGNLNLSTPAGIIRDLELRRPIYAATAASGHFGRKEAGFTWERVDRVDLLRRFS